MRLCWRQLAGHAALLGLLLHLVLPLLTLQQAAARSAESAGFVICTGAGLVWITPDGTPASDGKSDTDAGYHCPVCFGKQLAAAALPATEAPLHLAPRQVSRPTLPGQHAIPVRASAPPLPARGPPPLA